MKRLEIPERSTVDAGFLMDCSEPIFEMKKNGEFDHSFPRIRSPSLFSRRRRIPRTNDERLIIAFSPFPHHSCLFSMGHDTR
jgi:hypothetical protein